MNRKLKWLLVALSVVAATVIGTAAAALAAGPQDPDTCLQDRPGLRGGGWGQGGIIYNQSVTDLLGLTPQEIQEQRQEGKSLAQIAADRGVSEEDLINAILADRKEILQEKVAAGIITQEQADQRLEIMKENLTEAVNRTTIGPPDDRSVRGNCFGNRQAAPWGMRDSQNQFGYGSPGSGMGPGMMQRFGRGGS